MKVSGRNIKKRLYSLSLISNKLSRAKYYHGYGVHSPFVYGLVRKVFMCNRLYDEANASLYSALLAEGVAVKRAIQLQNTMLYCECATFAINGDGSADFNVLVGEFSVEQLQQAATATKRAGTILAIVAPYANRERRDVCRAIIAAHRSTSVDNRGYLILFNNKPPKQHFRL